MGVSIIDGTLTAAEILRSRKGFTIFKSLTFRIDGGTDAMVKNQFAKDDLAASLRPGARGRFYLFDAAGVKGVHGVRLEDGTVRQAFPDPNKQLYLVMPPLALLGIAAALLVPDAPGLVAVGATLGLILMSFALILTRQAKRDALAQFESQAAPTRDAAPIISN